MWERVTSIAVFALVLAAPGALATSHETVVVDPTNDVYIDGYPAPAKVPVPNPVAEHLDILAVWLANETADSIDLGIRLKKWEPPSMPGARGIYLKFSIGNQNYTLQYPGWRCNADQVTMQVYRYFGSFPDLPVQCLKSRVDAAKGELVVTLPKTSLNNHLFVPWQVSDAITNLHAETLSAIAYSRDAAPDNGLGPAYVSRVGSGARGGDLFVSASKPVRASNGEATTVLYKATVRNEGTQARTVVVTLEKDFDQWTLRAPQRLQVPPQDQVEFPIILTMNFTHEHGKTQLFGVHVQDQHDPEHFAEAKFGIRWLDIPQPAGHHDRLWLHSQPNQNSLWGTPVKLSDLGWVNGWMNAVEQDPAGQNPVELPPDEDLQRAFAGPAFWRIFLTPDLEIGLDLESGRPAVFETSLRPMTPATRARFNTTLALCDMRENSWNGTVNCDRGKQIDLLWGQVELGAISPNTVRTISVPLDMNPAVDRFPYVPGARLVLVTSLTADTPQSTIYQNGPLEPKILTKGSVIQLPLVEYHDPIDQAFERVGSLRLAPLDAHEKSVNPGRSSAFRFDLTNLASASQTLRIGAEGVNHGWATIRDGERLTLAPNDKRQITMIINVPDDAVAGERAELFLVAENVDDPSILAMARVRAVVVDLATADITDEASILDKEGGPGRTPSIMAPILLAALLGLAWARRRRVS